MDIGQPSVLVRSAHQKEFHMRRRVSRESEQCRGLTRSALQAWREEKGAL